jgi:putative glutamine amidotransferase
VCFAGRRYLDSVLRAGGEPVVISPQPITDGESNELMERFDGLILMGGGDVDPARYGQEAGPHIYGVLESQDHFETSLLEAAVRTAKPVLAICRGMQLANVALGGTLVQDLSDLPNAGDLIDHKPTGFPVGAEYTLHEIRLAEGSTLSRAVGGTSIQGASFHHQGIGVLANGFKEVGWAPDGLLEAIEHDEHWLVGVQWHPEDTSADDPQQQRIYEAFVERARSLRC